MALWQERLRTVQAVGVLAVVVAVAWVKIRTPESAATTSFPKIRAARVAAASDLRFALDEIATAYAKEHTGIEPPQVTYGSSGTLYSQIVNGAPFDVFLSANLEYPRRLAEGDKVEGGTVVTYAAGRLALWVPAKSPIDIERVGIAAVADPRVTHVSIANPAHAPYGQAAEAAMRAANVYETAKPKLVLGENVAQALQFVQSGAADIGIVALALTRSPEASAAGRAASVPDDLYPRMDQGAAVVRTERSDQGRDFQRFLTTEAARDVLVRYGFAVPER
jgi:molybdate transport system substrate-binding protein